MKENQHTYAKILKDENHYVYDVIITKTYDENGKHHEKSEKLPFSFRSLDIAKDFITVLPDKIEKVSIKKYRCPNCHLCFICYDTYKLSVGDFEVYIKWSGVKTSDIGFIVSRYHMQSCGGVVDGFTSNLKPIRFNRLSDNNDVKFDDDFAALSELIKMLKEYKKYRNSEKEEYNFELVQQ